MVILRTVRDVVEAIGRSTVIQLTDRTTQSVTNWCTDNRFPPNTYVVLTQALARSGKAAPASLWGMTEPVEAAQ